MQSTVSNINSYDSALKRRLSQRLVRLFRLSLISTYLVLLITTAHPALLFGSHFVSAWSDLITQHLLVKPAWSLVAGLAVVPILILRKRNLANPFPPVASSRISNLRLILQSPSYHVLAAYLTSSLVLFYIWWHLSLLSAPNPNLDILIPLKIASKPEVSDLVQFNPRFLYLVLASTCFSFVYATTHILKRRSTVHFEYAIQQSSMLTRTTRLFQNCFFGTSLPTLITFNFGLPVAWLVLRRAILRALVYNTPFRQYFAATYRHSSISSTLLLRSVACTALQAAVWDVVNCLFDVYCTQAVLVSATLPAANDALLEGLQNPDRQRRQLAFLELALVAQQDPARRQSIFKEVARTPTTFQRLCTISCTQLSTSRATMQARGAVKQPARAELPASQPVHKTSIPSVPIKTGNVVLPTKPTFLDRFAATQSDPSPFPAPPAQSGSSAQNTATQEQPQSTPSKVPSVFMSPASKDKKPVPHSTTSASQSLQQQPSVTVPSITSSKLSRWIADNFQKLLPARVTALPTYKWLYAASPQAEIPRCCPTPQMDLWVIKALAALLENSLQDDPYGIAQKEVGKVLETYLEYSSALDSLVKELGSKNEAVKDLLAQDLQPLLTGVQTNMASVLKAYKPFLVELKMQPVLVDRLQVYLDWA